jgi:metallo-beta-lactamase family protein
MAKLTFLGAAGCVTGSKYLVEAAGKKLLIDCGLFQGLDDLKQRNWNPLPVDPKTIDYLVLTHAHLDHTGWLPVLVRDGYRKPIYANPATIELTGLLLKDSGHLQEEETQNAIKNKLSTHAEPRALYIAADVEPVLAQLKPMTRRGGFDLSPEFHFESYDAGHILGSSSLELTITENGKKSVVVFSGDVGRYDQPILNDPTSPATKQIDALLC